MVDHLIMKWEIIVVCGCVLTLVLPVAWGFYLIICCMFSANKESWQALILNGHALSVTFILLLNILELEFSLLFVFAALKHTDT